MQLQIIILALLGRLFPTSAASAGSTTGTGCCTAGNSCADKKAPVADCRKTNDGCKGKVCGTTTRQYYTQPDGKRGLSWRAERDCTKEYPLAGDSKHTACGKGKSVSHYKI